MEEQERRDVVNYMVHYIQFYLFVFGNVNQGGENTPFAVGALGKSYLPHPLRGCWGWVSGSQLFTLIIWHQI